MIRPVLTEVGIFLIATKNGVALKSSWPMPVMIRLAIAAAVLVIVSLVLLAQFSGAPPDSTYVPAHIENGKFVPGVEIPGKPGAGK